MRVLIISDHALMSKALRMVAEGAGAGLVVETLASKVLSEAEWQGQFNIALLDVDTVPTELSLQICEKVARTRDNPALITVQSLGPHVHTPEPFLSAGAIACVFLSPLALPMASGLYISHSRDSNSHGLSFRADTANLDVRILSGVSRGLHDREIGRLLGYETDYVKHRIEAVIHQNGLRGRAQLGMWMRDRGYPLTPWVEGDETTSIGSD